MQGVQRRMVSVIIFFVFLKIYFSVAIFDLVHDLEAIFHRPYSANSIGNYYDRSNKYRQFLL